MRPFGNKRTHASNGEELSEIFIGEDGTLSVFFNEDECEIVGFDSTVHRNIIKLVRK